MTGPKKAKATRRKNSASKGKQSPIEIRMYNVGFGDSFLLRVPTGEGERRVLIDCGFHSQGKGQFSDVELVNQIKADLEGEPLDVVIATHRHQDHISGFGETQLWANVPVNEVWLPFTANPDAVHDEPALAAWNSFMEQAHRLWDTSGNLTPSALAAIGARNSEERAAAQFMLWNARRNAPAIDNLLNGFKRGDGRPAKRRFLPDRKDTHYPSQFETPVLPGVKIHVLGPPTDPKFRRNLRVPGEWGMYDGTPCASGVDSRLPFFGGMAGSVRPASIAPALSRKDTRRDSAFQRRSVLLGESRGWFSERREHRVASGDRQRAFVAARRRGSGVLDDDHEQCGRAGVGSERDFPQSGSSRKPQRHSDQLCE